MLSKILNRYKQSFSQHPINDSKRFFVIFQTIFVVLLILVGYSFIQVVSNQKDAAHLVNLSASQGTLSQKLAKSSLYVVSTKNMIARKEKVSEMIRDLKRLKEVHQALQYGSEKFGLSPKKQSQEITNKFNLIFFYYNNFAISVENLIRRSDGLEKPLSDDIISNAYLQLLLNAESNYLRLMDEITTQFDSEAREENTQVELFGVITVASLILLQIFGIYFIYIPGFRKMNSAVNNLSLSEERYRTVVNSLNEVIIQLDENGNIKFHNPTWNDLIELEKDETSTSFWENLALDYADSYRKSFNKLVSGEIECFNQEIKIRTLTNKFKWVDSYSQLLSNKNSDSLKILVTLLDITERKYAELEIQHFIAQLQEQKLQIEKSANEIMDMNVKLTQSESQLKELNASKDKFFSIIAHDLKSPITGFLGVSELLLQEFDELSAEEIKQLTNNIYRSANAIFNLLENLLSWSRIHTGRMQYTPSEFNLSESVLSMLEVYHLSAFKKKINLETQIEDNIAMFADKNMIDTVIRNLLGNAIKFTPENGKVTLRIKTINQSVQILVVDTGVGMNEQTLKSLFRIDTHISSLGTNGERGTGLGLILCKELIEKNKGVISVNTELGVGSTFEVLIPKEGVSQMHIGA